MGTMSTSTEVASTTVVRVVREGERVRVHLATDAPEGAPRVRPMLLSTDTSSARVALVPDGALLLAGDWVRIVVDVGAGALLELVEPGGTVAYDMEGGLARWDVSVSAGEGARLLWHGEPFVVSGGARVRRDMQVVLAPDAAVALREVLVLGRHGEQSGFLDQHVACTDDAGRPLLVEGLCVDDASRDALLGGHRVVASTTAFGIDAAVPGPHVVHFALEDGGHLYRACAASAHDAADHALWDQVARAIRSRTANSMPTASAR